MKTRIATIATALLTATFGPGCEPAGPETELTQRSSVSECGGFAETREAGLEYGEEGYCAAERLEWSYEGDSRTLVLTDARALLNCCGERSVSLEVVDGGLVVTETDAPETGGGRCFCMCVFDFQLTVEGLEAAPMALRLVRDVTDAEGGPAVLFDGVIDLAAGSGAAVISDDDASGFCEEEAEPLSYSSEVSECGGFGVSDGPDGPDGPGEGYCAAERLEWSYDASIGALELVDSRALLNCCGDRSMTAELVDGVYVVTETDSADPYGRCDCLCVFDLALTIDSVPEGTISLRLVRDVVDEGGASVLWEGALDLSAGSGSEVVSDEDVGVWCEMRG